VKRGCIREFTGLYALLSATFCFRGTRFVL
jgi:hypothetical protein